ncbi:MAG: hypothetical protein IKW76_11255, partial [Clostridia bacterium]|nr:hypothetical protein [Clostridia bacterium]
QEVITHTFTINAPEKDDAEEIAYNVLHGRATNEELDAVLDETVEMNDHFTSREVKNSRIRSYEKEEND